MNFQLFVIPKASDSFFVMLSEMVFGLGFSCPPKSPSVTIISKFFEPMFSSNVVSNSCLAEPAAVFKKPQLFKSLCI